ncbi:MAG TPA: TIGR02587 family membrane protein [Leptolyngbyaceae cyanobacterium]
MARHLVFSPRKEWQLELTDLIRGLSGGFLFGIPLFYTMEAWWIGSSTGPPQMLALLAVTYVIVFLLNRTDGFRQIRPDGPWQAAGDSLEAIAIGVVCSLTMLILLRQITLQTPLNEIVGKTVVEGMPFALGVALARSILKADEDDNQKGEKAPADSSQPSQSADAVRKDTLADIGATLVGAIIIASNIAPTDEIPTLEAALTPPWLLLLMGVSLLLSYCIVFAAGFTSQKKRMQQKGLFQRPLTETVMSYLISLATAAAMLWFFHRVDLQDPWILWFKDTLILGLPATIGGAAGRLTI